ncbi:MAG TPA: hypothetical protein VMU95_13305 [Trebonia sp.]|nr:hypothetical protein [Trebonia sp.]
MARAAAMRASLAFEVAMTWTAAMKLADGVNTSRPTAKAAIGAGWAMILLIRLGFLFFLGFGLRRARKIPAASAMTPRPRRRPYRGCRWCGWLRPPAWMATRITMPRITVIVTAPAR